MIIAVAHNSAFWRAFFQGFANAGRDPHLWWIFLPLGIGALVIGVRRALPRWRWLHVSICLVGLIAYASLIWFRDTSSLMTSGTVGIVGLGMVLVLGAILLAAIGEGTDQGEG